MFKRFGLALCLLLISAVALQAQQKEIDLAQEYVRRGNYAKAAETYKPLAKDDKLLPRIYSSYVQSLRQLKDFETAIKLTRRLYKQTRRIEWLGELANLEAESGDRKASERYLEDALDECKKPETCQALASWAFKNGRPALAEQAYLKARKLTGDPTAYAYELAQALKAQGQTDRMLDELFAQAERDPMALMEVQGILQQSLEKKEEITAFERRLLGKIQQSPDAQIYSELLYWLYLQQKDFDGAFVQARAIDRRQGSREAYPARLMEVAALARSNRDLQKAEEIYSYVATEFSSTQAAFQAMKAVTNIKEDRVRAAYPLNLADARSLAQDYRRLLARPDVRQEAATIKLSLAEVEGFLLERYDTALLLLDEVLLQSRYQMDLPQRAKLDKGDLYLLKNEPWESTLLYSQVEKDAKDQPLGHEAKLRNARLSFFRGEFKLAQDHLDVLKLATSREIANDAMQLSLMIQDNLVFDTTGEALRPFARAELLLMKNRYDEALRTLDSIPMVFSGHTLLDDVLWKRAQILRRTQRYAQALAVLEQIMAKYATDIYGDDALYAMAQIYEENLKEPEQAMKRYEQLLKDFPGSIYQVESRKRFRKLRGDGV